MTSQPIGYPITDVGRDDHKSRPGTSGAHWASCLGWLRGAEYDSPAVIDRKKTRTRYPAGVLLKRLLLDRL